ncbi:paired amphipathic helix [Pterulicium gracile]|uniref:Paired amphipathic helix n=1 Tax=Pterulicium gracile TaxID=1884261 RepID=A0A5C3QGL3_9AGAR|nr:paired amphipathic helix [Pterula gracilis]
MDATRISPESHAAIVGVTVGDGASLENTAGKPEEIESTIPQPQAQPSLSAPLTIEEIQRRLNSSEYPVDATCALGYLDSVKNRFQDQPEVYTRFMGIMQDFRTQSIDITGVIKLVSQLFQGHPALFQGFNTFLPEGYRIEAREGETSITVTTPSGVWTQPSGVVAEGGSVDGSSGNGNGSTG